MIRTIVAKDFRWMQQEGKWKTENCPLGEGMVDFDKYFRMLKQLSVSVPVSMHVEYPIGGAEHGSRQISITPKQVADTMRKDLKTLKGQLVQARL